ncbi:hypothetical protein ASF34_00020 [Methylobacterium sp. Leaf106]|nr:hypothetical protein ASF34_00020 [Methylobacterium sp. Leaf106]
MTILDEDALELVHQDGGRLRLNLIDRFLGLSALVSYLAEMLAGVAQFSMYPFQKIVLSGTLGMTRGGLMSKRLAELGPLSTPFTAKVVGTKIRRQNRSSELTLISAAPATPYPSASLGIHQFEGISMTRLSIHRKPPIRPLGRSATTVGRIGPRRTPRPFPIPPEV